MAFQPDDLKRLARLARIAVTDTELATLGTDMNGIFSLIDDLQAVDTSGIEPLSHPLDIVAEQVLRLRDDAVTERDRRDDLMANAPATENGLFLVPRVIE